MPIKYKLQLTRLQVQEGVRDTSPYPVGTVITGHVKELPRKGIAFCIKEPRPLEQKTLEMHILPTTDMSEKNGVFKDSCSIYRGVVLEKELIPALSEVRAAHKKKMLEKFNLVPQLKGILPESNPKSNTPRTRMVTEGVEVKQKQIAL